MQNFLAIINLIHINFFWPSCGIVARIPASIARASSSLGSKGTLVSLQGNFRTLAVYVIYVKVVVIRTGKDGISSSRPKTFKLVKYTIVFVKIA